VMSLLWAGKLKPVIDRVMPLSQGIEATGSWSGENNSGRLS